MVVYLSYRAAVKCLPRRTEGLQLPAGIPEYFPIASYPDAVFLMQQAEIWFRDMRNLCEMVAAILFHKNVFFRKHPEVAVIVLADIEHLPAFQKLVSVVLQCVSVEAEQPHGSTYPHIPVLFLIYTVDSRGKPLFLTDLGLYIFLFGDKCR